MVEVTTKKALEVKKELESRTGEMITIYKGAEDARFNNEYHAYFRSWKGFQTKGTYGEYYRSSSTIEGLLN